MISLYTVSYDEKNVYIKGISDFDLPHTLDCGQAFRWTEAGNNIWTGCAYNHFLKLEKKDNIIIFYNTSKKDFESVWKDYFDFDRDYSIVLDAVSSNEILKKASDYSYGIRILNQEPWETLCSFIISQNNNIKRIKGIITRLCENFGEKRDEWYTFPDASVIANLSLDDLEILRSGFRAKYILDAAKKVSSGEVNLSSLYNKNIDEARDELMKINGVGPKVADCVLLFSLKHVEAFPKDVWIKKAMAVLFNGELPLVAKPYAGIVQQYIFFYARETKLNI